MSKILLVEDEQFLRELYARTLTKSGHLVTEAVDGEEALAFANQNPEVILLDIMLPKMHGIDVLKILKSHPNTKGIPVILMTNLGQDGIIKEAYRIGAQGYIMKMRVTPYELAKKVEDFMKDPHQKMNAEVSIE
jgi:CheY-like chemotaxis protein